jgi:hypothetical protein
MNPSRSPSQSNTPRRGAGQGARERGEGDHQGAFRFYRRGRTPVMNRKNREALGRLYENGWPRMNTRTSQTESEIEFRSCQRFLQKPRMKTGGKIHHVRITWVSFNGLGCFNSCFFKSSYPYYPCTGIVRMRG